MQSAPATGDGVIEGDGVITGDIGRTLAEMSFGCPPAVTRALFSALERGELGYIGENDVARLQTAVAEWLDTSYDWRPRSEEIRPVSDLVGGFRAVLTHFLPEGAPIIVPTPGYMPFTTMPNQMNRPVIEVPMIREGGAWRYDFAGIRRAFAAGARLLVLCNPHNPIGKVATPSELDEIEHIVAEHDGLVFSDEIHAPLILGAAPHQVYAARSARAAAHTITATSASKAFNIPGVKCGQLVFSNPDHLAHWQSIGHWYEHQTSVLGVVATEAAYSFGRPWLTETIDYLRQTVADTAATIEQSAEQTGLQIIRPDATYLLWIDLNDSGLLRAEQSAAQTVYDAAKLVVTDGAGCGVAGRGFIRFNAAIPHPHAREAMRRLERAAILTGAAR
ncbi:aminotransferase class I/II-fold pyridoxal phosphate-dependent enzyme [Leucobacter insecticola]|uniref:cysteine-S-conjugate beta-lyase n=1 Tax=Leucobacter insecticola TaxID=2714934 RepID=A0A6G8FM88_9MICO|nr:aminotransferase class I/II-fold pyridoxal phosphate-dependent enzyme [Leucobacter insecticola]QIM17202.1 aminotransferase class I/II-fold pyridoxal phosphate-dependent enzyme [Leucobacter insecticola]